MSQTIEINAPDIVAEVAAAFQSYEAAISTNDVETLNRHFWQSDLTLRYGLGENLYGHAAIAEFRGNRSGQGVARRLFNTRITSFGRNFATADTEFERLASGRRGRQSQTWVRLPEGGRITAAHVSFFDADGDTKGR